MTIGSRRERGTDAAPTRGAAMVVVEAAAVCAALSYGFSRLTGALSERVAFPVGVPALALGLALSLWAPRRYGWTWGLTGRMAGALAAWVVLVVAVIGGYRLLVSAAPYAPTFAELVVVPVGEEALFRGFLLSTLMLVFAPRLDAGATARAAVGVSAIAFGIGHLGNLGYVPTAFVLVQALAATLLGILAGWLRIRTGSLAGPVLVHAAMNAAAVL